MPDGPTLELRPGEKFFRADGVPTFILGRNPTALSPEAFDDRFRSAAAAGERLVRIHFTYSPPNERPGEIDADLLTAWDSVIDRAEKQGLVVLPVLGVWADWNDGSQHESWHAWDNNPFNISHGGPAKSPAELFQDSPCRKLWFRRLQKLVTHWSDRRNILGWEVFSEVDLVTGASEARAVDFVEQSASVIRAADPMKRPVTASQAGINEWPELLRSHAVSFVEVHPYADGKYGGNLDDMILSSVRSRLSRYDKPVLIGECGLDSASPRGTLEMASRASVGIRHAVWAAMVSGAMNGRALWWEDGYDQFEKVDLSSHYNDIASAASAFAKGIDYSGFAPLRCTPSKGIKGAILGNDRSAVGWFRDTECTPPNWPIRRLASQQVTLDLAAGRWAIEFIDPVSGKSLGKRSYTAAGNGITLEIPEFQDSIAFRLNAADAPSRK